jgi:hypothetical protein
VAVPGGKAGHFLSGNYRLIENRGPSSDFLEICFHFDGRWIANRPPSFERILLPRKRFGPIRIENRARTNLASDYGKIAFHGQTA